MNGTCIVPECLNIEGIPLSKNPECIDKLIQIFELDKDICTSESFICFEHFNDTHLEQEEHTVPSNISAEEVITEDACCNEEDLVFTKNNNEEKSEEFCRVCLSKEHLNICVFDLIEENVTIASAIMLCAHSVKIVDDYFPRNICETCFETLQVAYKFHKKCVVTDKILQIRYQKRKRKSMQVELDAVQCKKSKQYKTDQNKSVDFEVLDDNNDALKLGNVPLESKGHGTSNIMKLLHLDEYSMDEVERNMEVIHRRSESPTKDIFLLKDTSLKDSCSSVNEFLEKTESCSVKERTTDPPTTSNKQLKILQNKKLSPSLKIKRIPQHKSAIGKFKGIVKMGIYDSCFIQVDGYLFEYGLLKGSIRHLRCTLPNCLANGKQVLLPDSKYNEIVEVLSPHNHEAPSENMIKKHMFLCWMRKKMQNDKTANIRNIYEDACFQDPDIKNVIPLRNVVNEICRHQLTHKISNITSFEMFYKLIETDAFDKLHFTHSNEQFYQEKFYVEEDESMAVLFANMATIDQLADSQIMCVDASFKIDTTEDFKYQLVTVLVWIDDSYFPILYVLVNKKSQLLFRRIFTYLHNEFAPELRPQEIVTDYEANIYYALAEIYTESSIGGSVFYYTQNLYKKLCSLNLSRDLETNSYFRNIYHMLLMLPLLPVNTILDGLNSIETEAKTLNISQLARPLFDHVRTQWILSVTPELFCVHKLESRINENVIAPFKKLRDFLLLTKGKGQRIQITITYVIEKIIELEHFLRSTYSKTDKKSFGRDLSSSQKKNVLRAWQYIEEHPKIEMGNFFAKVLGYIKCMENQLWIWGFYRYDGDTDDILINASHFSIELQEDETQEDELEYIQIPGNTIVMEAVVDHNGILQPREGTTDKQIETL